MYCTNCGKEIPDGVRFCRFCGSPAGEAETAPENMPSNEREENAPSRTRQEPKRKTALMAAVAVGAVLLCVLVGACIFLLKKDDAAFSENGKETSEKRDAGDNSGKKEEARETADKAGEAKEAQEAPAQEEAAGEEEDNTIPLIAVPVKSMSLRSEPGFAEDTVIRDIATGERMRWTGKTEMVDERDFYEVILEDGQTGYVSGDYCTPVYFEYDFDALDIVDTSKALYSYDEMIEDIAKLQDRYSGIIRTETIGYSLDGRELVEVILGNPQAPHQVMVQAAIHGREYMTALLVMKLIEYYAYYYEDGEYQGISYQDLLENTCIRALPMSNPDGVTISQYGIDGLHDLYYQDLVKVCYERDKEDLIYRQDTYGYMFWQDIFKYEDYDRYAEGYDQIITFEEYEANWKANANGVDLNRNFDVGWEEIESREVPAYSSFKGQAAVSEPETKALVDLAQERDYDAYISYHSRGQLIYMDTEGNTQEVTDRSRMLAEALRELNRYSLVGITEGSGTDMGGFGDYIQLKLQKASCTVETGKGPCPLGIEEFESMWNRNRETWARICNELY